jgi:hypothetical protein
MTMNVDAGETRGSGGTEEVDDVLAELETEDDTSYRAQRLQELKSEASAARNVATQAGQSAYRLLKDDDECLRFTTEFERAVVHFSHPEFARCDIMDNHCEAIAAKHNEYGNADVSFGKVDVRNAPFVVEKLGIRVLPAVLGFVKGVVKGRVTGFEGIAPGNKEDGANVTAALEARMVEWGILKKQLFDEVDMDEDEEITEKLSSKQRRGLRGRKQEVEDEDDDWD